jgi:hypothetical protein
MLPFLLWRSAVAFFGTSLPLGFLFKRIVGYLLKLNNNEAKVANFTSDLVKHEHFNFRNNISSRVS